VASLLADSVLLGLVVSNSSIFEPVLFDLVVEAEALGFLIPVLRVNI